MKQAAFSSTTDQCGGKRRNDTWRLGAYATSYLPEFGGSWCEPEAAFCCAALVLPDDTWADTAPQDMTAAKTANSRSFPIYARFSRRTDLNLPAFF